MDCRFNFLGAGGHLGSGPAVDYGNFLGVKAKGGAGAVYGGIPATNHGYAISHLNLLAQIYLSEKARPVHYAGTVFSFGSYLNTTVSPKAEKNGLKFTWVPFGGAAPSRTAMIGGHTDFTVTGIDEMLPFYQSKQAKIIAYFAAERHKAFPDVPTAAEFGYPLSSGTFRLITLPEGVPADRKAALLKGFEGCFNDSEFRALMKKLGLVPYWAAGDGLKEIIVEADDNLKIGLKAVGLIN